MATSGTAQQRSTQAAWSSARAAQRKVQEGQGTRVGSAASRWADDGVPASMPEIPKQPPACTISRSNAASIWSSNADVSRPADPEKTNNRPKTDSSPRNTNSRHHQPLSSAPMRVRDDAAQLGGKVDPMSLIASPSRGIESAEAATLGSAGEQDLTNLETQSRYRQYLSRRIKAHCEKYAVPLVGHAPPCPLLKETERSSDARLPSAQVGFGEILLGVRKLREAVVASKRRDGAAIEVYHLALLLAILTLEKGQISATIHRLVFEMYADVPVGASTAGWPATATSDLATLGDEGRASLDLFQDSVAARHHSASLLLLSHTCLGATTGSIEDNFADLKLKVLDSQGLSSELESDAITLASRVDRCMRQGDVLTFRQLFLGQHRVAAGRRLSSPTLWQRILLSQAFTRLQTKAWGQIKKVYLSVPLPPLSLPDANCTASQASLTSSLDRMHLNGAPVAADEWLERILLVDAAMMPFHASAVLPSSKVTPDQWDADSGSLRSDDFSARLAAREGRLAALFQTKGLASASTAPTTAPSAGLASACAQQAPLSPWSGRITADAATGCRSIKLR